MNLIDAIKSGKPFSRPGTPVFKPKGEGGSFVPRDILAEDWEIEEPKVEITRTQFWDAWRYAKSKLDFSVSEDLVKIMAKELGLGP